MEEARGKIRLGKKLEEEFRPGRSYSETCKLIKLLENLLQQQLNVISTSEVWEGRVYAIRDR